MENQKAAGIELKPWQPTPMVSHLSDSTKYSKLEETTMRKRRTPKITKMLEYQTLVRTAMHTLSRRECRATFAKRMIRTNHMRRIMRSDIMALAADAGWLGFLKITGANSK